MSLGPSRPGPFSRGSSAKELTDNVAPEETLREGPDSHHTPRKASISEEKCEIENNRATETGEEGHILTLVNAYRLNLHILCMLFIFEILSFCFIAVKSETLQVTGVSEKPVLSEEEVERKSKSIIDEFLHINDYKVQRHSALILNHL